MQDPAAYYQSMMAKQLHQQQQQQQPQFPDQEQLKCPRCDSPNTKFCYYNNYNLSQPRHFCKSCRRYWTKGGALRNVPVGGGSRKNAKRSTSSSTSPSNSQKKAKTPDPDPGSQKETNPDTDPTRMLYGFPIGDQDVKGMEMGGGGGGSFSSLLASNMQLGLGGIMLDGSGWDPGMGLGMGLRRSEAGNGGGGSPPEPSLCWKVAGKLPVMMEIRTPKTHKAKRVLEKRAPKLVENGKKTLILHGTKTSATLSSVLMELYRLKKGGAIKYSRRNENIRPFESGGETSLEFFSQKTDCSIFAYGSHTKKRPDNLVLGRMYDHHVYDLIEVGIDNFKSLLSFSYDKKIAPHEGSKPFICFTGEGFENVPELKQLKEVLTDLFRGEVVDNLNLTGLDRAYICSAISPTKVFLTHCAIKLKKSGSIVPRIELVEVGPSMDLVIRRNRLPNEGLRKEAMKSSKDKPKKKVKNVDQDDVLGKRGRIFIPEQEVGKTPLPDKSKGVKRERREGKLKKKKNKEEGSASKKHKESE